MKVLIVSYVDDNFGDNLIRISFESLLKIVFHNLKIQDYEFKKMHLKNIDSSLVCESDVIFFAGGGLFGLSYLNFFEYLDEITRLADEHHIPVIFSSMGINNMDATVETENCLKEILRRDCIQAVSVRENIDLFRHYAGENCHFEIEQVCDPAVWTRYLYPPITNTKHHVCVGINVVRGGLFQDNQKNWGLKNELQYLNDLKQLLDDANISYQFYTNGSFLDNNTLHYFAQEYHIPESLLVFPHSTREFVEAVDSCDCIVSIRMHSAIVSYALNKPSICLIWNDKIPLFYENIKRPEQAIPIEKWNASFVFEKIKEMLQDKNCLKDEAYLMRLYEYLYKIVSRLCKKEEPIYTFSMITEELLRNPISTKEDTIDYRLKCEKAEKHYLARFIELRKKDKEIKSLNHTIKSQENLILQQKQKLLENKNTIKNQELILQRQKARLDRFDSFFIVKIYHKIKKVFRKKN